MERRDVTPITKTTRAKEHRRHAETVIAGRLLAIFEQLCTVTREAREAGEDLQAARLTELGGSNEVAEGSPLHDATMAVCRAATDLLQPEDPTPHLRTRPPGHHQ